MGEKVCCFVSARIKLLIVLLLSKYPVIFFSNTCMVWNAEKDEMPCREVLLVEPYSKKPSNEKERGQAWTMIA